MRIRTATLQDIDACVKIGRTPELSYLFKASARDAREYLKEYLEKGILLVADDDGVAGFLNAEFMLGGFIWVDGFAVLPEMRGKGIGSQLFEHFIGVVKEKGYGKVYLVAPKANPATVAFYEKMGMEKGQEFYEFYMGLECE